MADYDVLILGSGPGGYVAAVRAGQLGMRTVVVENRELGGVCLNWGCIPSKALLRNAEVLDTFRHAKEYGISFDNLQYDFGHAVDRSRTVVRRLTNGVGFLFKKNNVAVVRGTGVFETANRVSIAGTGQSLTADNVIVATGASQRNLPNLPIDHQVVVTSRDALEMRNVPARVVIVGGGATGAEFAYIYRAYGAEVTIVELLTRIVPQEDEEVSEQLDRAFRRQGIKVLAGASVTSVNVAGDTATVGISAGLQASSIECDRVLVAVGVKGNTAGIGLERVGVETINSFVTIDERMRTNVPGVYAIGDVTGKMLLAHVASAQGVAAVEHIAGLSPPELDYSTMPRAIYCKPQVASFGLTEAQARERGYSVKIGKFPLSASGKAMAMGETLGLVKLVVDADTGEILGAHMIGPEVTELLGEASLVNLLEGTTEELGWLVHPHPTISETIKEAALAADGVAVHV